MEDQLSNCAQCPYEMAEHFYRKEDGKSPKSYPVVHKSDLLKIKFAYIFSTNYLISNLSLSLTLPCLVPYLLYWKFFGAPFYD